MFVERGGTTNAFRVLGRVVSGKNGKPRDSWMNVEIRINPQETRWDGWGFGGVIDCDGGELIRPSFLLFSELTVTDRGDEICGGASFN